MAEQLVAASCLHFRACVVHRGDRSFDDIKKQYVAKTVDTWVRGYQNISVCFTVLSVVSEKGLKCVSLRYSERIRILLLQYWESAPSSLVVFQTAGLATYRGLAMPQAVTR